MVLLGCSILSAMSYFLTESPPAWVTMEQATIPHLPIKLYLYSAEFKTLKKDTQYPFLRNTIDVWYKSHKQVGDTL